MRVSQIVPILRSFDELKAREFYVDFLGFVVAFEHRFEPGAPLYLSLIFQGFEFHLSEHHGDATPGSSVRIEMDDIDHFHAQLSAKKYKYARPGIQDQEWGFREVSVADPFGNRLVFCQSHESIKEKRNQRASN